MGGKKEKSKMSANGKIEKSKTSANEVTRTNPAFKPQHTKTSKAMARPPAAVAPRTGQKPHPKSEEQTRKEQKEEETQIRVATIRRIETITEHYLEAGKYKTPQDKKFYDSCVADPNYVKFTHRGKIDPVSAALTKNTAISYILSFVGRLVSRGDVWDKLHELNKSVEFKGKFTFNRVIYSHIENMCAAHNEKIRQEERRIEALKRERVEKIMEEFKVTTVPELIFSLVAYETKRVEARSRLCMDGDSTLAESAETQTPQLSCDSIPTEIFDRCFRIGSSFHACRLMLYISDLVKSKCNVEEEHIMRALTYDICPEEFTLEMSTYVKNAMLHWYVIKGLVHATNLEQRNMWSIVTAYAACV